MPDQTNQDVNALINQALEPIIAANKRLSELQNLVGRLNATGTAELSPKAKAEIIAAVRSEVPGVAASWKGANASPPESPQG